MNEVGNPKTAGNFTSASIDGRSACLQRHMASDVQAPCCPRLAVLCYLAAGSSCANTFSAPDLLLLSFTDARLAAARDLEVMDGKHAFVEQAFFTVRESAAQAAHLPLCLCCPCSVTSARGLRRRFCQPGAA